MVAELNRKIEYKTGNFNKARNSVIERLHDELMERKCWLKFLLISSIAPKYEDGSNYQSTFGAHVAHSQTLRERSIKAQSFCSSFPPGPASPPYEAYGHQLRSRNTSPVRDSLTLRYVCAAESLWRSLPWHNTCRGSKKDEGKKADSALGQNHRYLIYTW